MRISLSSPIPNLGCIPGPSRPGYPSGGELEFKLEIQGPATFSFNASKIAGGTNFSIDWGDNTVVSGLTGTSHTHTYGSGTFVLAINSKDDSGPIDTFQVTGTQTNKDAVKKILNWGTTPWVNLTSAFQNCHGLTNINKSDFFSGSAINLTSAFQNCDNLITVDFTGWKASGTVTGQNMFRDCTALQSFKLKGSINFANASSNNYWFRDSGVSTGCTFDISNLNFSGSTGNQANVQGWFYGSNIKIDSKLINWTFPSASWNLKEFFRTATIIGSNATVDLSNWTLPSNSSTVLEAMFREFSTVAAAGGTEQVVNMSNWNFGSAGNLKALFHSSGVRRITGLSTWSSNGLTNIQNLLFQAVNLSIDANDNFTSSFWNNSSISNGSLAFNQLGSSTTSSTAGAFPNLNGATFSSVNFNSMFLDSHFNTDVSLTGVNFPSTNNINFYSAFQGVELFHSNSTIDLSNTVVNALTVERAFRFAKVDNIVFGNDFDFTNCTGFAFSFRSTGDSTVDFPMPNVTFPIDSNRPNYSSATDTRSYPAIDFSTCQADNLIRALHDTGGNASGNASTFDLKDSQVTGAPSIVNSYLDNVLPSRGWTITSNSTDAALPFAYSEYMIDPDSGATSLTPSLLPPVADRNFSSTNPSMTINQTTGVLSWPSNFEGFTTVRCTYADGCYNEVSIGVQVPFTMRRLIPASGQTALVGTLGDQYIDWGDGVAETNNGNASHTYSAAGTGFGTWRTIKIFDKNATEKFTGIEPHGTYYDRVNIVKWGSPVFNNLRFSGVYALGIRTAANDPLNTTNLTSFQSMFASDSSYKTNARLIDPYNNLDTWKTSTATGGGAITTFESMFSGTSSLGQQCVNDESTFTFSFPAGTTATAGTYGNASNQAGNINGVTQSGTTITGTIKFQIIVDGSGTVTLDNTNTHIIPQYMWQGDNVSVGDVIRIDAGSFGSLNNNITCTLTSDNVLASNGVCNLNGWDTSQVSNFYGVFNHNAGRTGGRRVQNVNFGNWNLSSAEDFTLFTGLANAANLKGTDLIPKNVSAADSPTGSAYVAWDTSNVTNFNQFGLVGDNPLGILRYWRFNTTNTFNMSSMFMNQAALQTYASDEPCKTQIIPANDPNNPFGVAYTAWNMEKCSSVGQMAYKQSGSPTGMISMAPALSSWQISDSLTSFHNFSRAYSGSFTFTPTVGHWDPSGLTGNQYWHTTRSGQAWKFSQSAYDNLLIGWGAHASTVNSGVNLNMGVSKYTAGGAAEAGRTALINAGWTITDGGGIYSNTNALSFNGSSEYINSYGSSSLNLTSALTVSMYIKIEDETNSGFRGLFTKGDISPAGYGSYSAAVINAANNVRFYLNSGGSSSTPINITTTSGLEFDKWYHVCFTYDGSLSSNKAKIYIDGVNQSVSTSGTIPSSLYSNTSSNFYIGAYYSTSLLFEGKIDEVMVWNNVISTGNIQAYANVIGSGSIPDPNAITGLQLWNRMGD